VSMAELTHQVLDEFVCFIEPYMEENDLVVAPSFQVLFNAYYHGLLDERERQYDAHTAKLNECRNIAGLLRVDLYGRSLPR
jgi:hypothetical protein